MIKEIKKILLTESTRAKVIISSVYIEKLLEDLLCKFLIEGFNKEILKNEGPLSTFNHKIKMCFSLGLISNVEYLFLNTIREIRNLCAHSIGKEDSFEIELKDQEVIEILRKTIPKKEIQAIKDKDEKEKFIRIRKDNIIGETAEPLFCYIVLSMIDHLERRARNTRKREYPKSFKFDYIQKYLSFREFSELEIKNTNSKSRPTKQFS